jgi:hypothetical protein
VREQAAAEKNGAASVRMKTRAEIFGEDGEVLRRSGEGDGENAGGLGDAACTGVGLGVEQSGSADNGGELGGKSADFEHGGVGFCEETLAR